MRYLILLLFISCGTPEAKDTGMDAFNEQMRQDSINLQEKLKQIRWESSMRIELLGQGIKGEKAEHYIDSLSIKNFGGTIPEWYKKYKAEKN